MSNEITYAKVLARVESAAKDIIDEVAPMPKDSSEEAWQEFADKLEALLDGEARDYANESVDSWDWTIYTYQGFQVYDCLPSDLQTQCEEEYWDCNGSVEGASPYGLGASMAFFALVSLLTQEIERQCKEMQELAQDKIWQLERE